MKKINIKQVIIGIIGLLVSVGIFVLAFSIDKASGRWLTDTLFVVAFSCMLGSIFFIFFDLHMFLHGAMIGFGISIFLIFTFELPGMWKGIFIVVCAVIFFALPVIKEYIYDREENSMFPKNKKIARKIKEQKKLEEKLKAEYEEFLSSVDFGRKSLLLRVSGGGFYQCIKGKDKYYFIFVGGELHGIDSNLIKTDFSDEAAFIEKKKDYAINKEDIISVKYKTKKFQNSAFNDNKSIIIECKNKKRAFRVLESVPSENIKAFFEGINVNVKCKNVSDNVNNLAKENPEADNKKLISRLKLVCTVLFFVSVLVSAVFLFIDINYRIMSSLCMILFICIFILYIRYNDILSLDDKKGQKTFSKGKINIIFLIFIPSFALGIRSLLDIELTSYKNFVIFSILLFSIILFIFFLFTNEYKRKKSSIWVIIIVALFFAPAAVAQTNCIFDNSKEIITEARIYDMSISSGSKSTTTYQLDVEEPSGKRIELDVSKKFYERVAVGYTVVVGERKGLLNIPYAYVIEN